MKEATTLPESTAPRFGDPLLPERFWSKVSTHPNGCWLWTAGTDKDGYARFSRKNIWRLAYRISYQALIGSPAENDELDHLCHTRDTSCVGGSRCPHRRCVNPAHLEPVSRAENNRRNRSFAAANAAKTHCPQGHEYNVENTYRHSGRRHCRPCVRSRQAKYLARKRAERSGVKAS